MGRKLNIGSGETTVPGFEPWDVKNGKPGWPLQLADGSVEEIYASHVLEHWPYELTGAVLKDWFRVLEPGGRLRVAVPDFQLVVEAFIRQDHGAKVEGWILGGHTDPNDKHAALFTEQKLRQLMEGVGFERIAPWTAVISDCASLPISLNLEGYKPKPPAVVDAGLDAHALRVMAGLARQTIDAAPADQSRREVRGFVRPVQPPPAGDEITEQARIVGVISTPRLGFMDTFDSIFCTLPAFNVPLVRGTGVFWGQALTRAIEEAIDVHKADWILTLDYDSVWNGDDLRNLVRLLNAYPGKIDALVPHQWNRQLDRCLWTPIRQPDGSYPRVTVEQLRQSDLFEIGSGHFGLSLIRASVLKKMPHPWFLPTPNKEGRWTEGKEDDDIRFWRIFREAGGRAFLAPKVVIGHLELDLRWPSNDVTLLHQHLIDYQKSGRPKGVFGDAA